jgi:dTMP kinase
MTESPADGTRPGEGSPSPGRGLFLVLEGVEGAGKTTQLRLLRDALLAAGVPVREAREPGGTPLGEAVRGVLLDRGDLRIGPESELLLMLAARAAFAREVVQPALEAGEVMLADRFESSTFAYQGYGRGLPLDEVRRLNAFATGGLLPDLTLVLDLSLEEGRSRQLRQGKGADRIEGAGAEFHARVAEGYRALAAADPGIVLVDARGTEAQVHERILVAVRPVLRARRPESPLPPPEPAARPGGLKADAGGTPSHPPETEPDVDPSA